MPQKKAYSDDVTDVAASRLELVLLLPHFADICEVSSGKMKHAMSTGARLGIWDVKTEYFIYLTWSSITTKHLGVRLDPFSLSSGKGGVHLIGLREKSPHYRITFRPKHECSDRFDPIKSIKRRQRVHRRVYSSPF